MHEKCFLLRSLWVCDVLLLEYLQSYVVLVDFHWLGLSAHFTDYGWANSLRIRVKRVFGLNTHGLCVVDLIQDQGSKEENISCSLGCSLIRVKKLTFIFGGVLKICNVLIQNDQASFTFMYMIINSSEDKYKLSSSLLKLKCCLLDLDSQSPWHSWRNELFLAFSNSTESFNLPVPLLLYKE